MKLVRFLFLFLAFGVSVSSQPNAQALTTVEISFYNNSLLPHKFTIVSYAPFEKGNGTEQFVLLSYGKIKKTYKPGTRIFIANSKQVDVVMSGKTLDDKPFLTLKKDDNGKTFSLNAANK